MEENNSEIEQALKEFEAKSSTEETNQTGQVSPIDQIDQIPSAVKDVKTSAMARWVMKLSGGMIKEQRQAEYALLSFSIIAIAISIFLFFGSNNAKQPVKKITPNPKFIHTAN